MKRIVWAASLVFSLIIGQLSPAYAVTVKLDLAEVALPAAGDTFNIDLWFEDVTDLGGYQFDITYDTAIVKIANPGDVVLGPFLGAGGRTALSLGPVIDNDNGKVSFGGFSFGPQPGVNGSGIAASISFTVQTRSGGELSLQGIQMLDTSAGQIAVDAHTGTTLTANDQYSEHPVPTLQIWGIILLPLLIALFTIWVIRGKAKFQAS